MDLLGEESILRTGQGKDIYSRPHARPPHFIGSHATIRNSILSEGSEIYGSVTDSVLSGGVTVAEGAEVYRSVIMADVKIGRMARISYAIIDSDTVIGDGAVVGDPAGGRDSITVVGQHSRIEAKREKVIG